MKMVVKKLTKEVLKEMANKSYLEFIHEGQTEKEVNESLRDIVTRYGRKTNMGGYSADEIVGFLYIYFYEIHNKFNNYFREGINELIDERDKLKKELSHYK